MTQNNNDSNQHWFKSWLQPSNLIAIAALVASLWGGFSFFANSQNVDAENNCQVKGVTQNTGNKEALSQSVDCSDNSTIENVQQE